MVLRFIVSGCLSTAVNFSLLYLLTDRLHVWYVISVMISVGCAFAVGFVLQKFWTFGHRSLERLPMQLSLYVGVGLANIGLNAVLLYALVTYAGLYYLIAQVFCTALLAVLNFFAYRHLVFTEQVQL